MSSQSYRDKSLEEVRGLVEKYCENYQKIFGVPPDIEKLKQKFNELKLEKEEQIFQQAFFALSAKSLADCIKVADEISKPIKKQENNFFKGHKGKP